MTFNIRQLDTLTYDEVEPIFDEYITHVVEEFLASEIGQTYAAQHPEAGNWIATFVEMAYLYGECTIPKMTKRDAQTVMSAILPRKLTLPDPQVADSAIPELVAFWTYLKETYRFRSAGAIAKYLQSIDGQFREWMADPARGGPAKSFLMAGQNAGYDMTSPEQVSAFQAVYNQQNVTTEFPDLPQVPMVAPPEDVKELFDMLGVELPEAGTMVDPNVILNKMLDVATTMELMSGGDPIAIRQQLEQEMLQSFQAELEEEEFDRPGEIAPADLSMVSEKAIATLKAQAISETAPGTILQDFQTAIAFVDEAGMKASGKLRHFPLKELAALNQRLTHPIEIALKRPQQKSYPNIHGLYLLLRATGMITLKAKGKQQYWTIDSAARDRWNALNPTEQYFTLLEAWLVRGN
ncbi:MAG: hypothetical protein AAFX40_18090, partial [Cyanobacteria bacterium J06639_1]